MTSEEIQRVMEFIIKQQESLGDRMGQMLELHAQSEKRISVLERVSINIFNALTDLKDRMAELAEAQAHTDHRVNALIDIIEDQRRDGRSQT